MFKRAIVISSVVFILITLIFIGVVYACPVLKNLWITPSVAYKGDTLVGNIDWATIEGEVLAASVKWVSPTGVEYPLVIEVLANETGNWTFKVQLYGYPAGADKEKDQPGWSEWYETSNYVNPIIVSLAATPEKIDAEQGQSTTISWTLGRDVESYEVWINGTLIDFGGFLNAGTHTITWDGKIDGIIQYGENIIMVYVVRDLVTLIDDIDSTTVEVGRKLVTLSAEPLVLPADGSSESKLVANVIKEDGSADAGKTVVFEILNDGGSITVKPGKDITNNQGEAVATYKAGDVGERITIRAFLQEDATEFDEVEITLLQAQILVNDTEADDDDNVGVEQSIPITVKTIPDDYNGSLVIESEAQSKADFGGKKRAIISIINGGGSVNMDGKKESSNINDVPVNVKIEDINVKLAEEDLTVFKVKLKEIQDKEISSIPTMPEVKIETVVNPSAVKTYVDSNYKLERAIKIEWSGKKWSSKFENLDLNKKTEDWIVNFDNNFYGGTTTVTLKNDRLVLNETKTFKIKGTNPDEVEVENWIETFAINTTLGDNAAVKVARAESSSLDQFFGNGMPLEGKSGDMGIFQLLSDGSLTVPNGIWNWKTNVSDGCNWLEGKKDFVNQVNFAITDYTKGQTPGQIEIRYATVQSYNKLLLTSDKKIIPVMWFEYTLWPFGTWYMNTPYKGLYAEKTLNTPYGNYKQYTGKIK